MEVKAIRIWNQIFAIASVSEITLCVTLGKLLDIISLHFPTCKMRNNTNLFHRVIMRIELGNILGQWFSIPGAFSISRDIFYCYDSG